MLDVPASPIPIVPIMGNVSIGVGALSYAGQLSLTVVADRDACPDLERFVEGVRNSLDALAESTHAECDRPRSAARFSLRVEPLR